MTAVELKPDDVARLPGDRWVGHVFGVALESERPFPGVEATAPISARVTTWRQARGNEVDGAWKPDAGLALFERRHPDGRLFLLIERKAQTGFRIWAPYYGRHLVSADGCSIVSALPRVPTVRWQRLFFSQVLPLAAALHGLSLVRASAVALGDEVVGFIGPPGSGKTSLIAHLVALGAGFVSDNVLALDLSDSTVIAHPGPGRLSIDEAELRRIPSTQVLRLGPCVGRSDKLVLEPTPVQAALPLAGLYVLQPDSEAKRIAIEEVGTAEPLLPRHRAIDYLGSAEFDDRYAGICARVEAAASGYRIAFPPAARARDIAARVLAHRTDRREWSQRAG